MTNRDHSNYGTAESWGPKKTYYNSDSSGKTTAIAGVKNLRVNGNVNEFFILFLMSVNQLSKYIACVCISCMTSV